MSLFSNKKFTLTFIRPSGETQGEKKAFVKTSTAFMDLLGHKGGKIINTATTSDGWIVYVVKHD